MRLFGKIDGASVIYGAEIIDDIIKFPDFSDEYKFLMLTDEMSENHDFVVAFVSKDCKHFVIALLVKIGYRLYDPTDSDDLALIVKAIGGQK